MYFYSAFSLVIASELPLPDLPEGHGEPDVLIRFGDAGRPRPATLENEWMSPHGIGRFRVSLGREIILDPLPDTDAVTLAGLAQGRLLACLLRQRGCLPVHASAVTIGGAAILFIADCGFGKSTTAAAFYSRGHAVVADDTAALRMTDGVVKLHTAWPGLRLLADARGVIGPHGVSTGFRFDKYVYRTEGLPSCDPVPVRRLYFLSDDACGTRPGYRDGIGNEVIPVASAVAILNSNSFLRPWRSGHELLRMNFSRAASVAAGAPLHRLHRPRSLASLPALVDFVESDLAANG